MLEVDGLSSWHFGFYRQLCCCWRSLCHWMGEGWLAWRPCMITVHSLCWVSVPLGLGSLLSTVKGITASGPAGDCEKRGVSRIWFPRWSGPNHPLLNFWGTSPSELGFCFYPKELYSGSLPETSHTEAASQEAALERASQLTSVAGRSRKRLKSQEKHLKEHLPLHCPGGLQRRRSKYEIKTEDVSVQGQAEDTSEDVDVDVVGADQDN